MKHPAIQSLLIIAEKLESSDHHRFASEMKSLLQALDECWGDLLRQNADALKPMVHVAQMAEVGAHTAGLLETFSHAMAEIQEFLAQTRSHFDDQENVELASKSTAVARQLENIRQAHLLVDRMLGEGQAREMQASLEAVALEMFSVFQLQLDRQEIQIEVDLQRDLPRLQIESNHLFQILAHLVGNAIDSFHNASTRLIRIEGFDLGDQSLRVLVSDTGSGIPPAFRNRIFEPNFSTKGKHGTGLGLHIASLLVDGAGGYLRLAGSKETGTPQAFNTVFELVLPTQAAEIPAQNQASQNRPEVEVLEPLDDIEAFDDENLTHTA